MPRLGERYSRALVTGAGSGLGRAFASALMQEGVQVWGTSRQAFDREWWGAINPVELNLAKEKSLRDWFTKLDSESGGFDLVINNAGFAVLGPIEALSKREVDEQICVLLSAPIELASAAFKGLRERKASALVNVSSVAGEMWIPYMSLYNAAKAGLSAFSQSLMLESPMGPPWVIDFRPGDYRTSFNERVLRHAAQGPDRVWERMKQLWEEAPLPEVAAKDLVRSLKKFRHSTQYSGSFLQTNIASLAGRLLPNAVNRKILRRYYHLP